MRVSLKDTFCVVPAHEAFCCRSVHLLLHTGPQVSTPKCYSSTVDGLLTMVQLTSCDYWMIGGNEGDDYWCWDSREEHSIDYRWVKKISPVPERLVSGVADLLNLTLTALTNGFETLEVGFSNGQEQIFEEEETDGATVTHCGALNLTGNDMLLTEINTTCPAQREKDEHGVERYWPSIDVGKYGRTQKYSHFCPFCLMVLTAMGNFMLPLWYK